MTGGPIRYVDRTSEKDTSVEISFDGASSEKLGSDNPVCTNVHLRILQKSNIHLDTSPWIETISEQMGDLIMPSGPWNGIKITEIIEGRVFVALSNILSEIEVKTGRQLWSIETGNTPIYWIMASLSGHSLIVFNGYYQFRDSRNLSNLSRFSLSGKMQWRSPLPYGDDIFANNPYYDGELLKSSSWNGFNCTIDDATGEIVSREFTK